MLLDQNIEQNMQTNGRFYHVRFVITLIVEMIGLRDVVPERRVKGGF